MKGRWSQNRDRLEAFEPRSGALADLPDAQAERGLRRAEISGLIGGWIEKHRLGEHNKPVFLRKDVDKKDSIDNRQTFSELDAWDKVFEMYKIVYDKNNHKYYLILRAL